MPLNMLHNLIFERWLVSMKVEGYHGITVISISLPFVLEKILDSLHGITVLRHQKQQGVDHV